MKFWKKGRRISSDLLIKAKSKNPIDGWLPIEQINVGSPPIPLAVDMFYQLFWRKARVKHTAVYDTIKAMFTKQTKCSTGFPSPV